MPAKKKKRTANRKSSNMVMQMSYTQLLVQAVIIALIDAVAIYAILRVGILRDDVDRQVAEQFYQPVEYVQVDRP